VLESDGFGAMACRKRGRKRRGGGGKWGLRSVKKAGQGLKIIKKADEEEKQRCG
jgi:hypothetical protein